MVRQLKSGGFTDPTALAETAHFHVNRACAVTFIAVPASCYRKTTVCQRVLTAFPFQEALQCFAVIVWFSF